MASRFSESTSLPRGRACRQSVAGAPSGRETREFQANLCLPSFQQTRGFHWVSGCWRTLLASGFCVLCVKVESGHSYRKSVPSNIDKSAVTAGPRKRSHSASSGDRRCQTVPKGSLQRGLPIWSVENCRGGSVSSLGNRQCLEVERDTGTFLALRTVHPECRRVPRRLRFRGRQPAVLGQGERHHDVPRTPHWPLAPCRVPERPSLRF